MKSKMVLWGLLMILVCIVLINLSIGIECRLGNKVLLTFERVEALASPESPDFSPCVLAEGYCFYSIGN